MLALKNCTFFAIYILVDDSLYVFGRWCTTKYAHNTKHYFPPEPKTDTTAQLVRAYVQVDRTCKRFHAGAAVGTLAVVLLLPLSSARDDGEFDHDGDGDGGGGLAAAAAAVVAAC